ncbi:hypothetical protein AAL_03283 [Moelleriella libera RCEF 2490]|uniref:Nucleoside 2-deoxyribosyltransferase n=1 Tax=Moelleriella libera RCEF 2490 TaxID=1081109 RepID=A0A168D3T1_9HYPO|nr:hypothetical protein AAL_03283 [Moelleriella libera RCEF 2490]
MGAQIIQAPLRQKIEGRLSFFLAGTMSPDSQIGWRPVLIDETFSDLPITVFDPTRLDWDETWREDFSDARWVEQIQWELDMQELADVVVVFLGDTSVAPISMLELGLNAKSGKVLVCAMPRFAKRGNVEAICARYHVPLVSCVEDLQSAIKDILAKHSIL